MASCKQKVNLNLKTKIILEEHFLGINLTLDFSKIAF